MSGMTNKMEIGILVIFLGIIPGILSVLNVIFCIKRGKNKNEIISNIIIAIMSMAYIMFLIKVVGSYENNSQLAIPIVISNQYWWCESLSLWNIVAIIMQYKYIKKQVEE